LLFETTTRAFNLSACGQCHCFFIDPPPGSQELAVFYPTQYWWTVSPGLLKSMERIYRRVALRDHVAFIAKAAASLGRRPARLLDIGCGSGTLLALLKRRGFEVSGFDSSSVAARIANENDIDVIVGERLQDAGFLDGGFDLVTLFHVLEHVSDPRSVLAEVHRILQPNGRMILQVPNIDSWQSRLFGERWYGLDVPRHLINYSERSIRHLLFDSGFRVCRVRHFNLRDNAPALASSLFPSLDPVSRRARQRQRQATEPAAVAWVKHAAFLAMVALATPFAIVESLARAGGTLMLEAEKR
jgi:SAM-dependent methyltransferase